MSRALPSLSSLRAFEAAARLGSFARAGDELAVTHAAISHQIRGLEADLGVALFVRTGRAVELTPEGRQLAEPLGEAFGRIVHAVGRLRARVAGGPLEITVEPSFAVSWLVRALRDFRARHPDTDVRLSPSEARADLVRDGYDAGIRFGRGGWPGLAAERLVDEWVFPVAAPSLIAGPVPLRTPSDLARHTLLHDEQDDEWPRILDALGIDGVDGRAGPIFNDMNLALAAAMDGQGVALASTAIGAHDIAEGRLVRLFEVRVPCDLAYWLVTPEGIEDRPALARFRRWLRAATAPLRAEVGALDLAGAGPRA
jgi:LysR family glycine cleavage system transcriptional activator